MLSFDHGPAVLAPLAIAIPIVAACVLLVAGRTAPRAVSDVLAMATSGGVLAICAVILSQSTHGRVVTWAANWEPHHGYSVGIVLVADPVGAGVAVVAASLMTVALLYSSRYFEDIDAHYQSLMLLFLAGMIGLALTGDVFDMFVFFELMGASAYGLTAIKVEDESALQGALNFGIINSLGAYLSLMGIGLLFAKTGNVGLPQLGRALAGHKPGAIVAAAFVLVLVGFLVKGAMVPFHFWLADAHAVAPPSVCVLFSGVMVPLGIYSAFRIYWAAFAHALPPGEVRRTFVVMGAVTAVLGAVMALGQRHFKRLLAYSTIAHVGLFLVALGCLTTAGTAGALLYVAGHAGAKSSLFLISGVILNAYDSVDEIDLHGAARKRRGLAWLAVGGGLAIAGLPPFGTALGKAVSEEAGSAAGYLWIPALFVLVSALTGGAILRATGRIFFGLGPKPNPVEKGVRASGSTAHAETRLKGLPITMALPIVLLLAGALAVGIVPGIHSAANRAGAMFDSSFGYVAQALDRSHSVVSVAHPSNWTGLGIGLGFLSALLALVVAAAGIYGSALARRVPRVKLLNAPVTALHRLHSGHVGDYVAWLMFGIAMLAGFIGLPLR